MRVAILTLPGALRHQGSAVAPVIPGSAMTADPAEEIHDCFETHRLRRYEQDPRFGLIVLSESASRALSPAVNDRGTAIDILSRQLRRLSLWQNTRTSRCLTRSICRIWPCRT